MCLEVGPEGWYRCFANLFGGVTAEGMCSTLVLLPTLCFESSSEVAVGFVWLLFLLLLLLVFLCLLSRIFPSCMCMHLFLLLYSSFCFLRRHLSGYKHFSKGSQVPAYLSPLPGLQAATFSLYPYMVEREGRGAGLGTMGIRPTSCNSLVASTPVQPCCY